MTTLISPHVWNATLLRPCCQHCVIAATTITQSVPVFRSAGASRVRQSTNGSVQTFCLLQSRAAHQPWASARKHFTCRGRTPHISPKRGSTYRSAPDRLAQTDGVTLRACLCEKVHSLGTRPERAHRGPEFSPFCRTQVLRPRWMLHVEPAGDDAMRLQAPVPGRYRAGSDPTQSWLAVLEPMRLLRQEVSADQAGPPIAENFERARSGRAPSVRVVRLGGLTAMHQRGWRGADLVSVDARISSRASRRRTATPPSPRAARQAESRPEAARPQRGRRRCRPA